MISDEYDLKEIATLANIIIVNDVDKLLVKKYFTLKNEMVFGSLCLFLLGLFLCYESLNYHMSLLPLVLSVALVFLSVLVACAEGKSFIEVTNEGVTFRSFLFEKTHALNSKIKIIIRGNDFESESRYKRVVRLYLEDEGRKFYVFKFSLQNKYSKEVNILGNEVARLIKLRVNNL